MPKFCLVAYTKFLPSAPEMNKTKIYKYLKGDRYHGHSSNFASLIEHEVSLNYSSYGYLRVFYFGQTN